MPSFYPNADEKLKSLKESDSTEEKLKTIMNAVQQMGEQIRYQFRHVDLKELSVKKLVGILGIGQGGTGAADAQTACDNLGAVKKSGDTMTGTLTFDTNNAIAYEGTDSTLNMIKFKNGDQYGHGVVIGGGGLTAIGGGESADAIAGSISGGASEQLCLCNDGAIDIYTNCQNGAASATHTTIDNSGNFSGGAAKWSTARTLTVGNESKSVDGSGNVSWPHPLKIVFTGNSGTNKAGWYKVCTVSQSGYSDIHLNLLLTFGCNWEASGILLLHTRCNNGTAISLSSFKWMYRYGFDASSDRSNAYWKDNGNNTWTLYFYIDAADYGDLAVQILTETNTAGGQWNLTWAENRTKESSSPTGGYYATDGGISGFFASRTRYFNRLTSANQDFGNGILAYFHATSSMTTAKPPWGDGHILHFGWDNTHPNWASQLYVGNGGYNAGMRYYDGNTQAWKDWKRIWNEADAPMNSVVNITVASGASDASGSWVDHKTYSFAAGTWIIQYGVRWASNATGRRGIAAHTSVPTGYPGHSYGVMTAAANGQQTVLNITRVVRFTSATTIHFSSFQNSGSALEVNATAYAVRLCV